MLAIDFRASWQRLKYWLTPWSQAIVHTLLCTYAQIHTGACSNEHTVNLCIFATMQGANKKKTNQRLAYSNNRFKNTYEFQYPMNLFANILQECLAKGTGFLSETGREARMSASVAIWWLDNFCQPNVCEVNLKCTNSGPGKSLKSCNCHHFQ